MGMSMSMGMRTEQRHEQRQEQRQEMGMRQAAQMTMRVALIQAIHGEKFNPRARCTCGHDLRPIEILRGFRADPDDYTTQCPKCKRRFTAKLIATGRASDVELPFYCASQTLARLRHIAALPSDEFCKQHPAEYRSAIFHFGNIRTAYQKSGGDYPYDPVQDWQDKVTPFLGKAPDTQIALVVSQPVGVIRTMRKNLHIPRYRKGNEESLGMTLQETAS
ncbi:MAG: hypothetical protein G01um101425_765 [Candidatus Peregrinibacteria bacterium Gr01-1014_25]|nr:MAG: hypothetical protein G01um101425_765 [Candidatus Peregrinibacteria bacterium Gr01-1014_25]